MKRVISIVLFVLTALPGLVSANMTDYCSAPPYVTRTVPPNIMVLMDNSYGMKQQAYTGNYDSSVTYEGYFRSDLNYEYASNQWVPSATGAFSGNLLNWATTSSYDLLQKVLVGGLSTSRQTNVNTLVSDSDSWSLTYANCVFNITSGSLQITEDVENACSLLDSPPTAPVAWVPAQTENLVASNDGASWETLLQQGFEIAEKTIGLFANEAYAGKPLRIRTNSISDMNEGSAVSTYIQGEGGGSNYVWSVSSGTLPPGMSLASISATEAELSGTPTTVGDYTFTVQLTDDAGGSDTQSYTVTVVSSPLRSSSNYNVRVCVGDYALNCTNAPNGTVLKEGIVDEFWGQARFGLQDFNQQGSSINPNIGNCAPANPKSSFLTGIENATAVGNATTPTPLVNGLYNLVDYYQNNTTTNCNPFDNGAVPCTKSFILMITGGEGADLPAPADSPSVFSDTTNCGSLTYSLSKNACYAANNDLRSTVSGQAETSDQTVATYVVDTLKANEAILRETAEAGGGQYYDGTVPGTLREQLLNAFTDILAQAASGTAVSVLTTSSRGAGSMVQAYFLPARNEGARKVLWTGYTQNIWTDLEDNLREDSDGDKDLELNQDKVVKIYHDPNENETKAALFTTDANGENGNLATCSSTQVKDFGDLSYLWEAGEKLALKTPSSRTLITSKKVLRSSGGTTTITSIPTNTFTTATIAGNTTLETALNEEPSPSEFTAENVVRYVRGECLETGVNGDAACGATPNGIFRDRRLSVSGGATNGNVWKLGDIISSTPKVFANTPLNTYHIDYGDSSYFNYVTTNAYKNKTSVAFVGANDGMLHAFRLGYLKDKNLTGNVKAQFKDSSLSTAGNSNLGEELWGYIPFNAFPYLKYWANPNYCHIYFNDLSVRLTDASLGCDADTSCDAPDEARKTASWKTILIGGMRFGGGCTGGSPAPPIASAGYSAYYAIDVTDPTNPKPLWEFSDADMGYSTTFPSVVRTGAKDVNGRWYVVFGSGSTTLPKPSTDIARSTAGYVYILDLKTGALAKKIQLDHNAIVGDILAIDENKDYHAEQLFFGTSYLDGSWKGKLLSIDLPSQDLSSASWTPTVTTLFADNYPFTASPDATRDNLGNIWVYAGSGKYYSDVDEADSANQVFVGLKDHSSTTPKNLTSLDNRTTTQTLGTVSGTVQACLYDEGTDQFTLQNVVTSINPTSTATLASSTGWYVSLTGGERVISRPLAVGGLVDFLTYKPSSEPCSYGGDSYLYAVGYTTGTAPSNVAIQSPETTNGTTTGSVEIKKGILLGPGAPPTGEAIIIPPPKEGKEELKKKIQIATGVIVEAENKPVTSVVSKIVHWLKK